MFVYTAEPGSKSEEALNLLAELDCHTDGRRPMQITRNGLEPQRGLSGSRLGLHRHRRSAVAGHA